MKSIMSFVRNEDGAALAEYGLLVALIAVICIGAVTALGGNISTKLQETADAIVEPAG